MDNTVFSLSGVATNVRIQGKDLSMLEYSR